MSTVVCYCNHEEEKHMDSHMPGQASPYGCVIPGCECPEYRERARRRLDFGEWRDGAGDIQTEQWIMVIIEVGAERGPDVRSHGHIVGTEESAKEMLKEAAGSWGQGKSLGVAQIFMPAIVQHEATITWSDE